MNKFKVYLAGPISGLTYADGQDWRSYASDMLVFSGIDAYSPLRGKEFLKSRGILTGSYEGVLASDRGIMSRDAEDVRTCDLMLVNLLGAKQLSAGTLIEFGLAYAARKIVVCAMEPEGNLHEHPMVRAAINYRVDTLDKAIAVTEIVLLPRVPDPVVTGKL